MDLLTKNSKIAKSNVRAYNFGIPAFRDERGFATCPFAGACAKGCYAQAGAYKFSNVSKAFQARLDLVRQNPQAFTLQVLSELKRKKVERLRVHDSGDFFNPEYLQLWLDIAHASPTVQFYAYTKSVQWVKDAQAKGQVPTNFTFVFSYGGRQDHLIDRNRDRHSWVFSSLQALKDAGYADTSETDDNAADQNVRCIGLVYHGTKKLSNTQWQAVKGEPERKVS
jgi:hypothetical protein